MSRYIIILGAIGSILYSSQNLDIEKDKLAISNKIFKYYDKDRDGFLAYKEFVKYRLDESNRTIKSFAQKEIKRCDFNKNNYIDKNETTEVFTYVKNQKVKKCLFTKKEFDKIDKNSDNKLSISEIMFINRYGQFLNNYIDISKEDREKQMLKMYKKHLKDCDKNGDKRLSFKEATSIKCFMSSDEFLEYAKDINSTFEYEKIKQINKNLQKDRIINYRFKLCDKDKNGKLDIIEATSMVCKIPYENFKDMDKDKSNYVVLQEIIDYKNMKEKKRIRVPEIKKDMPLGIQLSLIVRYCNSQKDLKITPNEAMKCKIDKKRFSLLDINKNGVIDSKDLELNLTKENFKRVDKNSDKKISFKEFNEYREEFCF